MPISKVKADPKVLKNYFGRTGNTVKLDRFTERAAGLTQERSERTERKRAAVVGQMRSGGLCKA